MSIRTLSTYTAITFLLVVMFFVSLFFIFKPSHDRAWEAGHEALPYISFSGATTTITNFRHFDWSGPFTAKQNYETKVFSIEDIQSVSVLISHFSEHEGLAHIFLSFELATSTPIVISLETRREVGEKFSPLLGILRQFEIIYVVGDERDLVGVRTNYRDERVYLYPTKATPLEAQQLFRNLASNINTVFAEPQMYNTLTRNCTNEITRQVEKMSNLSFPLTWKTILPGHFDEVLYEMDIIDNTMSFADTKQSHLINNQSTNLMDENYSEVIRAGLGN